MSEFHPGPGQQPGSSGPRVSAAQLRDLSRLVRTASTSPEKRYVGGVAGGIARHLDIDPVLVRIALVVSVFFGGAGFVAYAAAWLLVPDEISGTAAISLDARTRIGALWLGLGVVALVLLGGIFGGSELAGGTVLVIAAALVVAFWWGRRENSTAPWSRTTGTAAPSGPAGTDLGHGAQPASVGAQWTGLADEQGAEQGATVTTGPVQPGAGGPPSVGRPLGGYEGFPKPSKPLPPTKRGPLLFSFTMGLVALAIGTLAVIDLAGASIAATAYPALALGVIALMLFVGSFWGRAGGLIAVGWLAVLALGVTALAQQWEGDSTVRATPLSASAVADSYKIGVGDLELDLRKVSDLSNLDGRTITLRGNAARIKVLLPEGINIRATGAATILGEVDLLGHHQNGPDIESGASWPSPVANAPSLSIDTTVGIGSIQVSTPNDPSGISVPFDPDSEFSDD